MTAFWGCVIHPGAKPTPFVPPPDGSRLHVSQATLGLGARNGERVAVMIHAGDEEKTSVLLCALRAGSADTTHLDLILDEYAEFTLEGDTPVHLCGNYMPDMDLRSRLMYGGDDEEEEEEDEDEDEEGALQSWMMSRYGAGMPFGGDDDDDDDVEYDEDEDEDEEEDELVPRKTTKKGGVVIQELNGEEDDEEEEEEEEEPAPRRQAGKHVEDDFIPLGGAAGAAGKKRPAQETAAQQGQQKKQAVSPGAGAPGSQAKQAQAQGGQKGRPEGGAPGQPSPGPASGSASKPGSQFTDGPPGSQGSRKFTNGLEIIMLANGKPDGKVALPGKRVSMKYVGRLKSNGKVFDATKGAPFTFRLGIGEVIKGWDIGVKNMRVGDKRRLIIPPDLGYGSKGAPGAIPPNAWLEFDVELVSVQ